MFLISGDTELLPQRLESLESTLVASYKCYEKALLLEPLEMDRNNLLRRLGNIHNELGVLYMNQAGSKLSYSFSRPYIIMCINYRIILLHSQPDLSKKI